MTSDQDQEDLSAFDAGVDDQTPVAWSYEVKRTVGKNGRTVRDWRRRLSRDKQEPSDWRQAEDEYYHLRNIIPLRPSRDPHPDNALGYEFKFKTLGGEIKTGLKKADPRGDDPNPLITCTPLVPIESRQED